jgi:hypothetical protein
MPLEPLNFPILQQVIPSVFLGSQPLFLDQLPHPHRRNAQDLSGLFRGDQAHLTQSCTPRGKINQPYSDHEALLLMQPQQLSTIPFPRAEPRFMVLRPGKPRAAF